MKPLTLAAQIQIYGMSCNNKQAWEAPRGSLHPKPGTPAACARLDGFAVGDLVVIGHLPGNGWLQSMYHWTSGDKPVQKVGEIIRIYTDKTRFLVCHEQAEYINVTASQMRHAERAEILADFRQREDRHNTRKVIDLKL
jgi:hypothetical protein